MLICHWHASFGELLTDARISFSDIKSYSLVLGLDKLTLRNGNKTAKRVVLGLSGGVDSSVAAWQLLQQDYHVTAVFMQNWRDESRDPDCSAEQDLTDARAVCDRLNIPLKTINFSQAYWDHVFQHFLAELNANRTPNPDILCNQEIKFKAFLNYALNQLNADLIATGHYAQIEATQGAYWLKKGTDPNKDQSYFLYRLTQYQLSHSLFPIGHLTKPTVRQMASAQNFINSSKKDSTGICFIGERKFQDFLSEYLLAKPGEIRTERDDCLGPHRGLMFYTLGQRSGLNIGGQRKYLQKPWYVIAKDAQNNVLRVAQDRHHPCLMSQQLLCDQVHWITYKPSLPLKCSAKIRYRQPDQACIVTQVDEMTYQVEFAKLQRAMTPGQSVVFYQGDICLGGGIII